MKFGALAYVSAVFILFSLPAFGQQVPRFDIEATCKAAQPLTAEDRNPYESCMREEIDAERQLKGMWSSASAGHRETCGQEAQIGGTPSYVDMLTCLQLAQGTASTAPPQRRRAPR